MRRLPKRGPTAERVRHVAARLGTEIDLRLVRIESSEDAVRERFLGSPTVRVNGIDIDPAAQARSDYGLSCRVYDGAEMPSEDMIVAALTEQTAPHRSTPAGRRRRLNRAMLAISALGVFAFSLFPHYVGNVFGGRQARNVAPERSDITLRVDGMTCAGCETGIEAAVRHLPGVVLADASYEKGVLLVDAAPGFALHVDDLVRAVAQVGYTAYVEGTNAAREPIEGTPTSLRVLGDDLEPVADAFNASSAPFRFLAILSPT